MHTHTHAHMHPRTHTHTQPTCTEIHHVIEALLSLKTESPALASSIDQLCGMLEERVRGWRQALQEHTDILQLFVTFSTLSQEVKCHMTTM